MNTPPEQGKKADSFCKLSDASEKQDSPPPQKEKNLAQIGGIKKI